MLWRGLAVLSQHHELVTRFGRSEKEEGSSQARVVSDKSNLSKDNVLHIVASHKAQGVLSQAKKFRSIHDKR